MKRDGLATHEDELSLLVSQLDQDVTKVLGQVVRLFFDEDESCVFTSVDGKR